MMSAGEELGRAEELRPNVPSAEANMSTAQLRDVGCAVRQGGFMGFTPMEVVRSRAICVHRLLRTCLARLALRWPYLVKRCMKR